MPSKSRLHFDENANDIHRLIDFYETAEVLCEEKLDSLPTNVDVVLKSALVLLVSFWEAYLEDIVSEAVEHLVSNLPDATNLPKDLKRHLASDLKKEPNELAVWSLSGDGWRELLKKRLQGLREARNRNFNTPKSIQTGDFLEKSLGLCDVLKRWSFDKITAEDAAKKLDELIELRGQIAHRGRLNQKIDKQLVQDSLKLINNIVSKTGGAVNSHLKKHTGKGLF